MAAGLKLEYSVIKNCLWYSRTNLNISETWFSYAADAPMTWPPVLPGTLFRYRTEVAGNIAYPSLYPWYACKVYASSTS